MLLLARHYQSNRNIEGLERLSDKCSGETRGEILAMLAFETAFQKCDVIVTPISPTPAFKIGEKVDDPLQMYLTDIFTIPLNLAGIAGISVPCGFSRKGLPIGVQIIAGPFAEGSILQVAYAYEQNTDWHLKKPHL